MRTSRTAVLWVLSLIFLCNIRPRAQGFDSPSKIDPDLQGILAAAKSGDRIPIFILLSRQGSLAEMKQYAATHKKIQLHDYAVKQLKELARVEQGALMAATHAPAIHPTLEFGKSFWVVNGLHAKATPASIVELGNSPLVARLYLRAEKPEQILIHSGRKSQVFPQPVSSPPATPPFLQASVKVVWSLKRIGAERAWKELGITGKNVVVAMMDSGMNYRHPDIRNRLWVNEKEIPNNNIDDDGNGYVDDYYGYNFANENPNISDDFFHGTICGAIIAGDGTSGIVTGVAPEARLMVLRMYDQTANFSTRTMWQFYQYDAWEAFQYAIENGAQVVNMSYDWQPSEKPLHAAWRYVLENVSGTGVTLVAGAGNSHPYLPVPFQLTPPASIPGVISVAGTLENDSTLPASSRGPVAWNSYLPFSDFPYPPGLPKPEIAAPVSVGDFPLVLFSGSGYVVDQRNAGTSTASPHVAGVVALLLEKNPELYPWEISSLLQQTARDLGAPGWDPYYGSGLVDAVALLKFGKQPRIRTEGFCSETMRWNTAGELELSMVNDGAEGNSIQVSLDGLYPKLLRNPAPQSIAHWQSGGRQQIVFALKKYLPGFSGTARFQLTVSDKSETYLRRNVRVEVGSPDLMLVDDDGGGEFEGPYESSLNELGVAYSYRSVRACPLDASGLNGVKTLVWLTGEENRETLTPADCKLLESYVASGGKLVLIGHHIAQDLARSTFLSSWLHASYAGESEGFNRLTIPLSGGSIEAVALPDNWRLDKIKPLEGARELFTYSPPEKSSGAIAVGTPSRVVLSSVGLECIDPAKRPALLQFLLR